MSRIYRGMRRLRARWRLHRMEWAEMHTPMNVPPGYEEFATLRSNLPGLAAVPPIKSWAHFKLVFRAAWRMYKHDYFPDPELAAKEEDEQKERKQLEKVEKAKRRRYQKKILADGREVVGIVKDSLPDSQQAFEERLDILNLSLEEFMAGYGETSTGVTSLLGENMYNPDLVRPENPPVVYEASRNGLG